MKTLLTVSIAILLGFTTTAAAKRRPAKATPAKAAADNCESIGESIKRCFVEGDADEVHLNISPDYPLIVTFEEKPDFAIGDNYIKANATDNHILFALKAARLPKGHKILVRTQTTTLTIHFKSVSKGADSQVQILRGDNEHRDLVVEQRVAAIRKELKAEYKQKLNTLDERANSIARKRLLQAIHEDGSQIARPSGEVRSRQDFLVLRAEKVLRIGNERFVLVTIEERKGDTFEIGNFTASVSHNGTKRSVDADFRCGSMAARPGQTVKCYISLGSIRKRGKLSAQIKVEGASGSRSVQLTGIGIP
tara:strand:- start:4824 stop:5744 length:921 start_codon:yes stop_codon:yes gene_type:complete